MSESPVPSKHDLLKQISASRATLQHALDRLSEQQLTAVRDAEGWTVKDHLLHLAAWERSVTALLRDEPRCDGLGVESAVYASGDFDAINAAIYLHGADRSAREALAVFRADHEELLHGLEALSDSDLGIPVRELPAGDAQDDRPLYRTILDNTAGHYAEHLPWIQALVPEKP
jgi:hypothetical protein